MEKYQNSLLIYAVASCLALFGAFLHDLVVPVGKGTLGLKEFEVKRVDYVAAYGFKCLSAIPLLLVMILRDGVGTDYLLYSSDYQTILMGGTTHTDIGFQALSRVLAYFGFSHIALFAICSIILVSGVYAVAVFVEKQLTMVVFLFLASFNYFTAFSLVAQYTAIGMLCWSFAFLLKRRYLLSASALLIACFFHSSSAVFVPVMFVFFLLKLFPKYRKQITGTVLLVASFGSIMLGTLLPPLLRSTRFIGYLSDNKYSSLSSGSQTAISIAVVLFMLGVYLLTKNTSNDVYFDLLFIIQFIAMSLSLAQSQITLLFRLIYSFAFFSIIAIPYTIELIHSRAIRISVRVCIVFAYIIWVIAFPFSSNNYDVLPYQTIGFSNI
jgi:hypothetical protein